MRALSNELILLNTLNELAKQDLTEEEENAIIKARVEAESDSLVAIDKYMGFDGALGAFSAMWKDKLQALQANIAWAERKREYIKEEIIAYMKAKGEHSLMIPSGRISLRKSTASNVYDEEAIPAEFKEVRQECKIRKDLILKALRDGEAVPGANLIEKDTLQVRR